MWTLRSKAKMFIVAVITLIAVDIMVGVPNQSQSGLDVPQRSISLTTNQ